jgi:hypothetical protein
VRADLCRFASLTNDRTVISRPVAGRPKESFDLPRYLISFDDGSMDHIPEGDLPAVDEAAHAVVREAKAEGGGSLAVASSVSRRALLRSTGPLRKERCLKQRPLLVGFRLLRFGRGMKRWGGRLALPRVADVHRRSAKLYTTRSPNVAECSESHVVRGRGSLRRIRNATPSALSRTPRVPSFRCRSANELGRVAMRSSAPQWAHFLRCNGNI